jgi:ASF1 like histone chaperone
MNALSSPQRVPLDRGWVPAVSQTKFPMLLPCITLPGTRHHYVVRDVQAEAPKADLIPAADLVGVTVILLTCSYKQSVRFQHSTACAGSSAW